MKNFLFTISVNVVAFVHRPLAFCWGTSMMLKNLYKGIYTKNREDINGANLLAPVIFFLFCLFLPLYFVSAKAAPAKSITTNSATFKSIENSYKWFKDKGFSVNYSYSYNHNLYKTQDGQNTDYFSGDFSLGYKINSNYTAGLSLGYLNDQDLSLVRDQLHIRYINLYLSQVVDWDDVNFKLYKIKVTPSLSLRTPLGRGAEVEELKFGLTPSVKLDLPEFESIKALSLSGKVTALWNSHDFETNLNGANTEFGLGYSVTANYSVNTNYKFLKKINLSASYRYNIAWSYEGVSKDYYGLSQNISAQISNFISAYFGHTNDRSFFSQNGQNIEFNLVDKRTSFLYGGLSINI